MPLEQEAWMNLKSPLPSTSATMPTWLMRAEEPKNTKSPTCTSSRSLMANPSCHWSRLLRPRRMLSATTVRPTDIVLGLLDDLRTRNVEQGFQLRVLYLVGHDIGNHFLIIGRTVFRCASAGEDGSDCKSHKHGSDGYEFLYLHVYFSLFIYIALVNCRFVFSTLQNSAKCTKRAAGFLILIQK